MQSVPKTLGNQRYLQLQAWLASPVQRAHRVLQVTATDWWPEGIVPLTRKAAGRLARTHREQAHAGHGVHPRRHHA